MWPDRATRTEDIAAADEPERGVLELLSEVAHGRQPPERIVEAVRAAPDGFTDRAIACLVATVTEPRAGEPVGAALEELVHTRGAVPAAIERTLPALLEEIRDVRAAGRLGVTTVEHGSAHGDLVIAHVVRYLYPRRGEIGAQPEWVLPLVERLARVNSERLADAVAERLRDPDADARSGAAEAAARLGVLAPTVAPLLRASLLDAVGGETFPREGSDHEVLDALAALYLAAPEDTQADPSELRRISEETLGLTKMSWNATTADGRDAIRLRMASEVGPVMAEVPEDRQPQRSYRYYSRRACASSYRSSRGA